MKGPSLDENASLVDLHLLMFQTAIDRNVVLVKKGSMQIQIILCPLVLATHLGRGGGTVSLN